MAKLLEKNGAEMCAALVEIAIPLRKFLDDPEFMRAFKKATVAGVKAQKTDVLEVYVDIVPILFGDKHVKDTMSILATIEGKTVKDLLAMNGTELIADALDAFQEQIAPFFLRLGISNGQN